MKSTKLFILITFFSLSIQAQESPRYKKAAYAEKTVSLENDQMSVHFFNRVAGWGWAELYTSSGKLMGVLEHLGEIMLRDQDIPIRFVAQDYKKSESEDNVTITFNVKSVVVRDVLKNTSFDNWMRYPFTEPAIIGTVTLSLLKDAPLLKLRYNLESTGNYYARYIRGPWLKVGEASFGSEKEDAILPGVDWAIKDEWTSGTDFFKDPWALRVVPHPNKVSIPLMAISHEGTGIGLSWNPHQVATRWFNYRPHVPQPVFAAPNFVDRMNNHIMGLMVPDATIEGHENEVYAEIPLELKIGQQINFDAEIWFSEGSSLDVVIDWVKRKGLPDPATPRWDYKTVLDKIANAYNTNFWHEGQGFGTNQRPEHKIRPNIPDFLERYIKENKKSQLAKELQEKIDWSMAQIPGYEKSKSIESLKNRGDAIIKEQREDGGFIFDLHNRNFGKDDFIVATSYIEPMGLHADTALEMVMSPALQLLDIANETGDQKYKDAAKKAYEFSMHMKRPEAGDYWETPIHAANLLAAGNAAIGYYEAYKAFGDERYKQKAIYWIRCLIPFTHLWESEHVEMLYYTKPVLSSSDWYFANWVRDHVQWEVLRVFAESSARGIYWADVDTEIDWDKYHKGITNAAINWINVHEDNRWRPHNLPLTYEGYVNGDFDFCYPDTHNSTTGEYGGMFIMPSGIVANIYAIIDHQGLTP